MVLRRRVAAHTVSCTHRSRICLICGLARICSTLTPSLSGQKGSYHDTAKCPVTQIFHLVSYLLPLSHCHGAWSVGMIFNHPFRIRHPEHASNFDLSPVRLGEQQTVPTRSTQFLRASHKRVFHQRPPTASRTDTHSPWDLRRHRQSKG